MLTVILKLALTTIMCIAIGIACIYTAINNRNNSTQTKFMVLFVVGVAFIATSIMYMLTLILFCFM